MIALESRLQAAFAKLRLKRDSNLIKASFS